MEKGRFSFEEHCTGIVQTPCGVTIADYLIGSAAASASLAENYVGLPY